MPIKLIPTKTNIAFINKKAICMALSLLVIIGTVALVATKGINFGIDFTGGIIIEAKTDSKVALADIRSALGQNVSLQRVDDLGEIMIRLPSDPNRENQEIITEVKAKLAAVIEGKIDYRRIDYVGPQVGNELIETAIIALLASFGAMLIYIWFRFEWQYGVGAILALVHDAIAVIGFYAVTQMEFNLSSVAAVLTVIGYSINDSVVIYDRVRENLRKYKKMPLAELLDLSINETLSRTIITGGTTLLALAALIIFGGSVLQSFAWGLFFGVLVGTYSSIYISAIVLLYVDPRKSEINEANTV